MPSTLNITRDAEDRIVGLSGDFSKWTNANGDDDHFAPEAVLLTVPENTVAHLTATLTVDDWGYIDIIPPIGAPIRVLDLSPNAGSPGPRGGHVRWGASTGIPYVLQSGTYTIVVRQDNAPYSEAYSSEAGSNISFCHVAIAVEYTETDRMIRILSSDEYAEIEETGTNVAGYIKTNDKVVNGHHAISVGLEYSGPSGDTSFNPTPTSTRLSDKFKPESISYDSTTGKARFKVYTLADDKETAIVSLNGASTSPVKYLPAVFEDKFEVTVYYTCMEEGFPSGETRSLDCLVGDSKTETIHLQGLNGNFCARVKIEGYGQLKTPVVHKGIEYPYLSYMGGKWCLDTIVRGSINNELVPKRSCAVDETVIARGSRIQIMLGEELMAAFGGNDVFIAEDKGDAVRNSHIDLYWGCDWPSTNNTSLPRGLAQGIASGNRFRVVLLSEA